MDFTLSAEQQDLVDSVETLLARHAGPGRAREVRAAGGFDRELMDALSEGGFLDLAAEGAGPLEAVLVVEAVARFGGCVPAAASALVLPAIGEGQPPGVVALVPAPSATGVRLTRYAEVADLFVVDDLLVAAADVEVTPVNSIFGFPFGSVSVRGTGTPVDSHVVHRWWQTALAAELVGTMDRALRMTVEHLRERKQFGRPLGSFQALQHRLAELHVGIEGARWLTRQAAAHDAPAQDVAAAAGYASTVAEQVVRETHQLSGAMGLTEEYDLYLWTTRLPALSLELGGAGAHHAGLALARWGGATA
jgi:alkylation response protein AidB-like acyl-CoA dehydrogenase